jgi:uncharacterized membrane protein
VVLRHFVRGAPRVDNRVRTAEAASTMSLLAVVLLCAFGIGVVSGLRSFTAPAVTAWAAHLGWLHLTGTPFRFMGTTAGVAVFTLLALIELVADKLPGTPSRTAPPGLIARILLGGLAGATLSAATEQVFAIGAVLGALGGVAGAFAGYQARTRSVKALKAPDFVVAIVEDLVAVGCGLFLVSRF